VVFVLDPLYRRRKVLSLNDLTGISAGASKKAIEYIAECLDIDWKVADKLTPELADAFHTGVITTTVQLIVYLKLQVAPADGPVIDQMLSKLSQQIVAKIRDRKDPDAVVQRTVPA
jgi:hypothetical protein